MYISLLSKAAGISISTAGPGLRNYNYNQMSWESRNCNYNQLSWESRNCNYNQLCWESRNCNYNQLCWETTTTINCVETLQLQMQVTFSFYISPRRHLGWYGVIFGSWYENWRRAILKLKTVCIVAPKCSLHQNLRQKSNIRTQQHTRTHTHTLMIGQELITVNFVT